MEWRQAEKSDIPVIRDMWERAKYGFDFPDLEKALSSWVAIHDDKIVGWSGAQLIPEIVAIMDPDWGCPHQRMALFGAFHKPVAKDMEAAGYFRGFCNVDPRYPRFAKRLLKSGLGWFKSWETLGILTQSVLNKKA